MLKSIATLMRGTLIAQAIGFLILPFLTRLYSPSDFGALQLYQSTIAILLVFATFRYEIALLRAKDSLELKSLLLSCFLINMLGVVSIATAITIYLIYDKNSMASVFPYAVWLLPVSFLISGTIQFSGYWLTREKAFGQSANGKVAQSCGYVAAGSMIGLIAPQSSGLVIADIFGKLVSLVWISRWYRREWRLLADHVTKQDMLSAIRTYREFPLIAVPGGLINALGGVLTPIMIYATFSGVVAGQFGLVERSLTLPVALVVASVSQVFSSQLSESLRADRHEARAVFHRYVILLAAVGGLPALFLFFFAPQLFAIMFGPNWVQAGKFAGTLGFAYMFMLISGGTNMTLMLLGMQKFQMVWEAGRLCAMVGLWALARQMHWSASTVVIGHAAVIILASVAFIGMAELGLRRRYALDPDQPDSAVIAASLRSIE
jgi:teichuronic acid exporter